jgi:hypothetical protein
MTLRFNTQEIVEAVSDIYYVNVLPLTLTAVLYDGTPIEGTDCVIIRGQSKSFNKADFNRDGIVDMADFTTMSENWLKPAINKVDINTDGMVDIVDFAILAEGWLQSSRE